MKRRDIDLNRAFDATPRAFHDRVETTLRDLKEEPPVKRFTLRTALVAALILLLLCGIAYAVVFQGQEWYYQNRFTAYREHSPEKHQAIMDSLETDVPQTHTPDPAALVAVVVQDYAWVPEQGLLTMSVAARAANPDADELHPKMNLDADGAWEPDGVLREEESHAEHYLWTEKGFGLPADMMDDPAKRLLLWEPTWDSTTIGDTDVRMPLSSEDAFRAADGACVSVLAFDLTWLDRDAIPGRFAEALREADGVRATTPTETLRPGDEGDGVKDLQRALSDAGLYNGHINGVYDEETQRQVAVFQRQNGLVADGVAGVNTLNALFAAQEKAAGAESAPDPERRKEIEARIAALQLEADAMAAAIAEATDADGMLTLRLNYTVTPLVDGVLESPEEGAMEFRILVR